MTPKRVEDVIAAGAAAVEADGRGGDEGREPARTPAERLENSRLLSIAIGVFGIIFIVRYFIGGGRIGFNILNFIFLVAGIMLHGTPIRYVRAVNRAVRTCGGIILQFPFYAGIMGMMIHSGLAVTLSEIFVSISSGRTFPLFTFLSAGLVNFFVPSGGGQWAVQGPIMIPAAAELGVSNATTALAIAWGDAWTNLVQPFWALPLLAVARLRIRDIMGYTTVVLIFSGIVTMLFMLFVF
jgi:short-chain fatty acids transporter